ncbi:aldehyde dehydrogenase family protein, partial [Magnetococcales bacterium HHB-1]
MTTVMVEKITQVPNWIDNQERGALNNQTFDKFEPHSGQKLYDVARSSEKDVHEAIHVAAKAQKSWSNRTPVERGDILQKFTQALQQHKEELAEIVARETGKSNKDALGETGGAIQQGFFWAGEGMRLFGRTLPSGVPGKFSATIRQPHGVAGLIVPANTPIANIAWKIFPALICGNAVVLKAAEDAPATAWLVARIAKEAGLPAGLLNVIQGLGPEAGQPLVEDERVAVISFTGSTRVGQLINKTAAERMARVSLELGGKNPLVVCDDAAMDNALKWVLLSAFSNAGQRCASGSRILVFDSIY